MSASTLFMVLWFMVIGSLSGIYLVPVAIDAEKEKSFFKIKLAKDTLLQLSLLLLSVALTIVLLLITPMVQREQQTNNQELATRIAKSEAQNYQQVGQYTTDLNQLEYFEELDFEEDQVEFYLSPDQRTLRIQYSSGTTTASGSFFNNSFTLVLDKQQVKFYDSDTNTNFAIGTIIGFALLIFSVGWVLLIMRPRHHD